MHSEKLGLQMRLELVSGFIPQLHVNPYIYRLYVNLPTKSLLLAFLLVKQIIGMANTMTSCRNIGLFLFMIMWLSTLCPTFPSWGHGVFSHLFCREAGTTNKYLFSCVQFWALCTAFCNVCGSCGCD